MTSLTQTEVLLLWDDKYEVSFQILKTFSTLILILLIIGKDLIVYYDALWLGLGIVLMLYENMIAYALTQLKFYEKN